MRQNKTVELIHFGYTYFVNYLAKLSEELSKYLNVKCELTYSNELQKLELPANENKAPNLHMFEMKPIS